MKQNKEHIDLSVIDQRSKLFFAGGKFNWGKSKADIWAIIEEKMNVQPKGRSVVRHLSLNKWAVAASIAVLVVLGSFLRFHTVAIETSPGQHLLVELPDRSKVNLNADSKLSYYPYWWKVKRIVRLEGEGFFEVEKGKAFTVISSKGTTQVLGTSFNIFSREDIYKVTCISGSVKVKSKSEFEAILKPNSKAEIQPDGKIKVLVEIEPFPEISWRKNIFLFTASPVLRVFKEIERQYGVKIDARIDNQSLYTGNFTKDQNVEETLSYICPALGLKYIRKSGVEYLIIKEDE